MIEPIQILERSTERIIGIDLNSKLLQSNIILITDVLCPETVTTYQAQLLYLRSIMTPEESQTTPIQICINSPGGEVYSTLGLYDTMQMLINEGYTIQTVNMGLAASGASVILMSGSKGHRYSLPNCTTMVHQPSGGVSGTTNEIMVEANESKRLKDKIADIAIKHACEDVVALLEKDSYLSAKDALKYNIIDSIK